MTATRRTVLSVIAANQTARAAGTVTGLAADGRIDRDMDAVGVDGEPRQPRPAEDDADSMSEEEFFESLDLSFDFDAVARTVDAANPPEGPDPYVLAGLMSTVFGEAEVSLRAVAVLRDATPGRVLAELECLRGLRAAVEPHPGFYRCTAATPVCAQSVGEHVVRAARERAERWYLASSRAAAGFLPAAVGVVADCVSRSESDPAIVDVFSALAWSRQAHPTLLHLARWALDERRHESAVKLASAAVAAATADASAAACWEAAEMLLAAARAGDDVRAEACGLEQLAAVLARDGDHVQARRMLVVALALHRGGGDRSGIGSAAVALGVVHLRGGDLATAERWLTVALGVARRCGDRDMLARAQQNLGHALLLGDPRGRVEALGLLASAGARHSTVGDLVGQAFCGRLIASAARRQPGGHPSLALRFARQAVDAAEASGTAALSGHEYAEAGRCVAAAGHPASARAWHETALLLLFHRAGDGRRARADGEAADIAEHGVPGAAQLAALPGPRRASASIGERRGRAEALEPSARLADQGTDARRAWWTRAARGRRADAVGGAGR